jgi:hypothetical protein
MGHPSLCARFVLETLAGTVHLLACTVAHFANLVGSPLGVVLGGVGRLLLPRFLANHGVLKGNWGDLIGGFIMGGYNLGKFNRGNEFGGIWLDMPKRRIFPTL